MIKLKQILTLLLVAISTCINAQLPVPTLIGSEKYSTKGTVGLPTINYPLPAGKNRMIIVSTQIERVRTTTGNTNLPNTDPLNKGAYPYVNGTKMPAQVTEAVNMDYSKLVASMSLRSMLVPDNLSGTISITYPDFTTPLTADDEISVIVLTYENVAGFIRKRFEDFGTSVTILNTISTTGVTGSYVVKANGASASDTYPWNSASTIPLGRTINDFIFQANGYMSSENLMSLSPGWTKIDNIVVANTTGGTLGTVYAEHTGISQIVGILKPTNNTIPTSSINSTPPNQAAHFRAHTIAALLPLASPSVSGKVVTPALNSTTGTQGGGLWVNVVDKATNLVVAKVSVGSTGDFTIPTGSLVETYNYDFILSKNQGTVGSPAPAKEFNVGWITVEEGISSTTPDGAANSIFNWTAGAANLTGVRFAIMTNPCSIGTDSDGDGIADDCDLDDDNDGILDTAENSCNLTTSTTWSGTASPVTGTNGSGVTANNITMTSVATTGANTSFTASPNGAFNTTNFWSNSAVAGANSLQFVHTWDTTPEDTQQANVDGGTRTYTITFAKPVNKAIIHLDRLGGNYQIPPANYFSNSTEFTLTSSGISMKKLAGNNQLIVTGNKFYRSVGDDLGSVNPGGEANNTNGTAAGSIEFSSATGQLFNSLTFTVIGQGFDGQGNDGMEFIIESCIGTDTDGDGIPNHLDLDSDADGCPDAIEGGAAFTTSDLQNSSMAGGNSGAGYIGTPVSVTQNLGNTVGNTPSTMGVPAIAGTPQTVNNATNSFVNDCISFVCPPDPYAAQQTWWLADGFTTPIHPVIIDFKTGSPVVSTPSTGYGNGYPSYLNFNGLGYEGNTTVTHPVTKEFLFATDGNTLFRGSDGVAATGTSVGGSTSAGEAVAVIPDPNGILGQSFLILGNSSWNKPGGLNMSKYDLATNTLTDLKILLPYGSIYEALEVIPHTNGNDYWILVNTIDQKVKSYLYSKASGFNSTPVSSTDVTNMTGVDPNFIATMSFISWDPRTSNKVLISRHNKVGLANFDPSTGALGTWDVKVTYSTGSINDSWVGYSAALSPNGRYIYYEGGNKTLMYYDLQTSSSNQLATVTAVSTGVKIGPDNKLYVVGYTGSGTRGLYYYANPDSPSPSTSTLSLLNTNGYTLPNQLPNNVYWGCVTCQSGTAAPALASTNITSNPATVGNLIALLSASNQPTGTVITIHSGTPATDANKLANSTAIVAGTTYYAAFYDGLAICYSPTTAVSVGTTYCYKTAATDAGNTYPSKHGITALGRAGTDSDNWPMVRQSAWTVLEAKTKGFVVNRVKFNASNQPVADNGTTLVITSPVEGMMVYDITNNCLKVYTSNNGGSTFAWHCMSTQACPQ